MPFIKPTTKGVEPLQTVSPFELQEAETINQCQGVKCQGDYNGCYVSNISAGDYIKVRNVDFGEAGAQSMKVKVRVEKKCTLLVRVKTKTGTVKGRIALEPTNGEWQEIACDLSTPITGVNDIFFTFTGSIGTSATLFDFDNWQFFAETMGIDGTSARMPKGEESDRWYTVDGKNVNGTPAKKGVYVKDHKKIVK
jgi:hypothetical protein